MSLGAIKKRRELAVKESPFAKKLAERKSLQTKHSNRSTQKQLSKNSQGRKINPREHAVVLNELYEAGWKPTDAYKPAQTEEIRNLLLELAEANARATRKAMKRRWK